MKVLILASELPETPEGWTRQMMMHLNLGSKGGQGTYKVFDAAGDETPIIFQYDTTDKSGKSTGFHVPDGKSDLFRTWAELRAAWPGIVRSLKMAAQHK